MTATATTLKEEVVRVLDQLPKDRVAEVLDFALFVKARSYGSVLERRQLIKYVPTENINALKGIVALGGDAVEDAERLYDGTD